VQGGIKKKMKSYKSATLSQLQFIKKYSKDSKAKKRAIKEIKIRKKGKNRL
jgi:hypothetical protein